jgi:hypothetical protein
VLTLPLSRTISCLSSVALHRRFCEVPYGTSRQLFSRAETKSGAAAIKARPAAMRLSAAEHGPDRGVGGVGYLIPRTLKAGIRRRQRRAGDAPKKFDRTGRPSITKTERPRSANLLQMPRGLMCKLRQRGRDYGGPAGSRRIDPSLQPLPPSQQLLGPPFMDGRHPGDPATHLG